jgi:two-component system cell cycle sensor histidine kinase/response regulator CckA
VSDGSDDNDISSLRRRVADLEARLAEAERRAPLSDPGGGLDPAARLLERETLLAGAERAAQIGTWVWDLRSNEVTWSPELYRILGYDPRRDRASAEAFFRCIHPDDVERVRSQSARMSATSDASPVAFRVVHASGAARDVIMAGVGVRWENGKPARFVGTVLDITERKMLEEQLRQSQKMDALGRLASGIAHDFNNLLMVIEGYTQILLRESPREELEQIAAAGAAAADLTRRLLAFSRKSVLEPVVLDLNQAVEGAVKLISRVIGEDIKVSLELGPDLFRIRADAGQVHQALLNLALNARDAMPDGGRLVIRTSNVVLDRTPQDSAEIEMAMSGGAKDRVGSGPTEHAALEVTDTGVGMDEQTRSRIFEPFFTTKPPGKGTGLGLSTVFGVVRRSGGVIDVASSPGRGTTFKLFFPRTLDQAPDSIARSSARGSMRGFEGVLVVEDDAAVRRLLARVLGEAGYNVYGARLPSEARALWRTERGRIALVITDVIMPEQSGRDLVRDLRREGPVRVLYITGHAPRHAEGEDAPLDAPYLPKPFTPDELLAKVRHTLRR